MIGEEGIQWFPPTVTSELDLAARRPMRVLNGIPDDGIARALKRPLFPYSVVCRSRFFILCSTVDKETAMGEKKKARIPSGMMDDSEL